MVICCAWYWCVSKIFGVFLGVVSCVVWVVVLVFGLLFWSLVLGSCLLVDCGLVVYFGYRCWVVVDVVVFAWGKGLVVEMRTMLCVVF